MPDDIQHRVERTSNKHSRAVYREGTVIIRLARNLSQREEREHVDALLRRMSRMVVKERERLVIDPFRPLLSGEPVAEIVLPDGRVHRFELSAGLKTKATRTEAGWRIQVGPRVRRAQLHRFLWKLLASVELPRVRELAGQIDRACFQAGIRQVKLSYASSLWGSCSAKGDILLNAALLFTPPRMLRYVIAHELAHRRVRDHSKRFWAEVERGSPDHKEIRRELRKYRICSL